MSDLRRIFATLLQLIRLRLDLISVELDEQLAFAANLLLWHIVIILCAALFVVFLALTVIVLCWDTHRLLAAGGVTLVFGLIGLTGVGVVRSRLRERPRFLAATIDELRRDAGALRGDD